MLLRTARPINVGDRVVVRFMALPGRPLEIQIFGRAVRVERRVQSGPGGRNSLRCCLGPQSASSSKEHFAAMSGRTFRWNIVREGQRLHIHLSGVLNAGS